MPVIQVFVQMQFHAEMPAQKPQECSEAEEKTAYMNYCRTMFELRQKWMQSQKETSCGMLPHCGWEDAADPCFGVPPQSKRTENEAVSETKTECQRRR